MPTILRMKGYDDTGDAVFEEVWRPKTAFQEVHEAFDELYRKANPAPEIICDGCGKVTQGSAFFEITLMEATGDPLRALTACSTVCARKAIKTVRRGS